MSKIQELKSAVEAFHDAVTDHDYTVVSAAHYMGLFIVLHKVMKQGSGLLWSDVRAILNEVVGGQKPESDNPDFDLIKETSLALVAGGCDPATTRASFLDSFTKVITTYEEHLADVKTLDTSRYIGEWLVMKESDLVDGCIKQIVHEWMSTHGNNQSGLVEHIWTQVCAVQFDLCVDKVGE